MTNGSYFPNACIRLFMKPSWKPRGEMGSPRNAFMQRLQHVQLVSERVAVGIISNPHPLAFRAKGVVLKPFSDKSLWFDTCVVMRKDDDSRLTNQFVRSFLRRFKLPAQGGSQMELSLSA